MIAKFYKFVCFLSLCFFVANLASQDLNCNDHINVGVNLSCEIDLTLDVFVEGDDDLGDDPNAPAYFYIIYDPAGAIMVMGDINGPSVVNNIVLDHVLDFSVFFGGFHLCSGTLILEDKVAPVIECDCPVGGEDLDGNGTIDGYAEECTLNCWELPIVKSKYWYQLTNRMVPNDVEDFLEDNVSDNCGGIGLHDISYYDVYIDLGCMEGTLLRRTWTVNYPSGGDSTRRPPAPENIILNRAVWSG